MPKQEQIEILNAQLLSFLRVDVDVPNHGDCLFDTLVHVWNVEVSENAPEAPWIVSARERGLSEEAIQQAPDQLPPINCYAMQAGLQWWMTCKHNCRSEQRRHPQSQRMKQRNTGSREHGLVRSVCYLMMRVLRANIKVVTDRPVRLDLYYEYRRETLRIHISTGKGNGSTPLSSRPLT